MLGQIDEWLFRSLSGIRQQPGTHGMRHLVIDPARVNGIGAVSTIIHTLYGEVKVDMRNYGNLQVTIPGGCDVQIRKQTLNTNDND
jgi:LDH2 family malate/lactate/ureidoglycolate dehydrogenase